MWVCDDIVEQFVTATQHQQVEPFWMLFDYLQLYKRTAHFFLKHKLNIVTSIMKVLFKAEIYNKNIQQRSETYKIFAAKALSHL